MADLARRFQMLKALTARCPGLGGMLAEALSSYLPQNRHPDEGADCDWHSRGLLMGRRRRLQSAEAASLARKTPGVIAFCIVACFPRIAVNLTHSRRFHPD